MIPKTYLYRHDEILTGRPYGLDVDEEGWAWEGCGINRLVGHHLDRAEVRVLSLPEMGGRVVYDLFAWEGRLVLTLGDAPYYLVVEPRQGRASRHPLPGSRPIVWYGTRTSDKLLLYERSEGQVLVLDAPEARPRPIPCPFPGDLGSGTLCSDGLVYSALTDPARMVRFDPVRERFVDQLVLPFPEAAISGRFEHRGILYGADSARGRLLPLRLDSATWLDPIPTPDHGRLYGFVGGGFGCRGQGYFCLSTWAHPSRLDPRTGRVVIPEGQLTVDDRPARFLDRYLVFDPESNRFEYLVAPEQPDGIPLLCYAWTDGQEFLISGILIPFAEPGCPGEQCGPWLVLQSRPASEESGFARHDLNWDRAAHLRSYRRSYPAFRSLYLPEPTWSPPVANMRGPGTQYPVGREAELLRRAEKTEARRYWRELAEDLLQGVAAPAEQVKVIARFVQRALYYNPIQSPLTSNPMAVLEAHDGRCGQGVGITRALLEAVGIESRTVPLNHHVVAEAWYDQGWHLVDALFFGENQPARNGVVLSVEELQGDPYFADAYPQECFVYDEELLRSEDGYQLLGYCFGPWGSAPYYSYYLGAEKDHPPTLPLVLPAQRLDEKTVRLRWAQSIKWGGGEVEYEVRVFADRACQQEVFQARVREEGIAFPVPQLNWLYFVRVWARDDHRLKNPRTWYPSSRGNFVLVPADQYGWYGVL